MVTPAPEWAPAALVDSHCHLDFPDFAGETGSIVARAAAAGVERMVTICTRLRQAPDVRAIAEAHDGVFWAAGGHPLHVHEEPEIALDELVALAAHPKLVGIGETGLDYHYSAETMPQQIVSLETHIEAARVTGLPLVIHARDADADIARILSDAHRAGRFNCVMHCFTAGRDLAETALGLGFYLSISGIATFRSATALRDVFAAAPRDRLLVETDAPYLAPQPHRGRRNEPAFVADTARIMAGHLGMAPDEMAAVTSANFDRLFAKAAAWRPE
jgi:TatD DNase family protein